MMKITTKKIVLAALFSAVSASVHAGAEAKDSGSVEGGNISVPQSRENGRWELHAGFGVRQAFDFRVQSGSRNLSGGSFSVADASADLDDSIGSLADQADRIYDDGFVNIGSQYNLTTFWGYNDASQVRGASTDWDPSQPWDAPGNQSLYLSRVGDTGIDGYRQGGDTGEELFPYVEGRRLWHGADTDFWDEKGVTFGWSWIPARAGLADSLSVLRTAVVDEYYLYGVVPPSAPYSGPALPPGALLDNIPQDRVLNGTGSDLIGRVSTDIDFDLHTLSLGGIWRHSPDVWSQEGVMRLHGLDLQAGLSLNYGKLSIKSTTTVTDQEQVIGSFQDRASESKFLPGLYLALGATLDVGERGDWMVFTSGRYDYADSIKVDSRHGSAEVDLDGLSWTIGIGRAW